MINQAVNDDDDDGRTSITYTNFLKKSVPYCFNTLFILIESFAVKIIPYIIVNSLACYVMFKKYIPLTNRQIDDRTAGETAKFITGF